MVEREVEAKIEALKSYQDDINKAFEEEIRLLKEGQKETSDRIGELDVKVNTNLKDLFDVNNSVRRELTKFTDYFIEERRESERRETEAKERALEAKERALEAKREVKERALEAKREAEQREHEAEKRADEIKLETRKQMFKLLGSGGLIFMIIQAIIQALLN